MTLDLSSLSDISALIRGQDTGNGIRKVKVDAIQPDPNQPRKAFDEDALAELAESIQSVGIIQPPVVRTHDGGYRLISGERRWRAARQLGWEMIEVIVRDDLNARAQLIENIQREALSAWEIYRVIAGELEAGAKQVDLASAFGKSKAWIAAYAAVAKMSSSFVTLLRENRVSGITALQYLYRLHEDRPEVARQLIDSQEPITAVLVEQASSRTFARHRAQSVGTSPVSCNLGVENVKPVSSESSPTIAPGKEERESPPARAPAPTRGSFAHPAIRIRAYYDNSSWIVDYTCQRDEADSAVSVKLVADDGSFRFERLESLKLQSIDVID